MLKWNWIGIFFCIIIIFWLLYLLILSVYSLRKLAISLSLSLPLFLSLAQCINPEWTNPEWKNPDYVNFQNYLIPIMNSYSRRVRPRAQTKGTWYNRNRLRKVSWDYHIREINHSWLYRWGLVHSGKRRSFIVFLLLSLTHTPSLGESNF